MNNGLWRLPHVVLDRPGVEDRSCECYGVVKKEYDRLLPEAAVV